jgi:hypothetical protein
MDFLRCGIQDMLDSYFVRYFQIKDMSFCKLYANRKKEQISILINKTWHIKKENPWIASTKMYIHFFFPGGQMQFPKLTMQIL